MLLDVHKTHHSAPQPNVTSMGASPVANGENLGLKVKDGFRASLLVLLFGDFLLAAWEISFGSFKADDLLRFLICFFLILFGTKQATLTHTSCQIFSARRYCAPTGERTAVLPREPFWSRDCVQS